MIFLANVSISAFMCALISQLERLSNLYYPPRTNYLLILGGHNGCMQKLSANDGFSLLQMSILLTIGALIVASTLPGGEGGSDAEKTRITYERMRKIEEATQNFMTQHQRRPYPADLTAAIDAAAYGAEIAPPSDYGAAVSTHFVETISPGTTTCTTGSPNMTITSSAIGNGWLVSASTGIPSTTAAQTQVVRANGTTPTISNAATSTCAGADFRNPLVMGAVPTKALGLPDEYAIDGFGRRIMYMVDQRATVETTCMDLQSNNIKGALAIGNSTDFSTSTMDHTMWALMSYGKDGEGAVSAQGASLTNRIKTGSTNAATLMNAFYNSSEANNYSGVLGVIKATPYTTFDDMVWYNESTKNTCCMGACNSKRDFRIDGAAVSDGPSFTAFGDVNGDGFADMIFGIAPSEQVRVIFGRKDGWPTPSAAFNTALDGTNGFVINRGTVSAGNFGSRVYTGDFNGDGYTDILVGGTGGGTGQAIVFGGPTWPASYTIGTSTSPTTAITISGLAVGDYSQPMIGDVNGDGYDDITVPYLNSTDTHLGVIYGKASGWANFTVSDANLNGTAGAYFYGTTLNSYLSLSSAGFFNGAVIPRYAVCDVNGDGYDDVLIPGFTEDGGVSTNTTQRLFVKLGKASWSNSSGAINLNSVTEPVVKLTFNTGGTNADETQFVFCKDINSDGYDDIFIQKSISSTEYLYVEYGAASFTGDRDVSSAANYDIRFNLTASAPSWLETNPSNRYRIIFGDVNNDGKTDIILSSRHDDPKVTISGTTFALDEAGATRTDAGVVYVVYQPSSWGATPGLNKNWYTDYNYNGTNGLRFVGVANDSLSLRATSDMNHDNKTDLLFSSNVAPGGGYFIFGKSNWTNATTYDMNCLRDTSGAHCANQSAAQ